MAKYRLSATWLLEGTAHSVIHALSNASTRNCWWLSALLPLSMDAVHCDFEGILTAPLHGELRGAVRLSVLEAGTVTSIHHEWQFTTRRWWMNIAAPVARWYFLHRYKATLRQGAEGLAHHVGARLLHECTEERPPLHSGKAPPFDLAAAVGAGCAAGVSSTFLQMGMWLILSYPVWDMLLRDSHLAAAIVLGPGVLAPSATFDLFIMLVASVLHFALSAAYGLAIAALVNRLKMTAALGVGAISGLLLFIGNMFGLTSVFPWFVASRDMATVVAHAGFGITVAACYRYAQPLGIRAHSS